MEFHRHSTVIAKVMLLYNTEWRYDHVMAVNYRSKKFYNLELWLKLSLPFPAVQLRLKLPDSGMQYFFQFLPFSYHYIFLILISVEKN